MYDGSCSTAIKKGEVHYIHHGGVSADDLTGLRALVKESGIPAVSTVSDDELLEMVRCSANDQQQQPNQKSLGACADDSVTLATSLAMSPKLPSGGSMVENSPSAGQRRLSLVQFNGVLQNMDRRQRMNSRSEAGDPFRHQREEEEFADALLDQYDGASAPGSTCGWGGGTTSGSEDRGAVGSPVTTATNRQRSIAINVLQQRLVDAGVPNAMKMFLQPGAMGSSYGDEDVISIRDVQAAVSTNDYADRRRSFKLPAGTAAALLLGGGIGSAGGSSLVDSATLFRRLGGDPEDSAMHVNRVSMLRLLRGSGLSEGEIAAYRYILERLDPPNINFDRFILEVVPLVDVYATGSGGNQGASSSTNSGPATSAAGSLSRADSSVLRRIQSQRGVLGEVGEDDVDDLLDDGDGLDEDDENGTTPRRHKVPKAQLQVALAIAMAGANRRSSLPGTEQLKIKIHKLLGEHVAKSRPDCTFPKPLTHLLRLDIGALSAFVLERRAHIRNTAVFLGPLAMRVLRVLDRAIVALRTHVTTCRVCCNNGRDSPSASCGSSPVARKEAANCTKPHFSMNRLPDPSPRRRV